MRWKISHHGHDPRQQAKQHDPRQIDLLAVILLIATISAAWFYFVHQPTATSTAAFIVPSQSVRW